MKYLIILSFLFLMNLQVYSQWESLHDEGMNDFCTMDFVNDSVGWIAGYGGTLIKTSDGGKNWIPIPLDPNYNIDKIDFVNALKGWGYGWNEDTTGSWERIYIKTIDGGNNWTVLKDVGIHWPRTFHVVNDSILIILSTHEKVIKSTDGGMSWIEVLSESENNHLISSYFLNDKIGIIVGSYGSESGLILKTFDGGQSWKDSIIIDFRTIGNLKFINNSTGYFMARTHEDEVLFCETTDSCHSWSILSRDTVNNVSISDYIILENGIIYVIGIVRSDLTSYQISRSSDFLKSWENLFSIQGCRISDLHIGNNESGIAIGTFGRGWPGPTFGPTSGSILLSNNHPQKKWILEKLVSYPLFDISYISQDIGIICGGSSGLHASSGKIFITEDAGKSWAQTYTTNSMIEKVKNINRLTAFALSKENWSGCKLIKTSDGGKTWFEVFSSEWYDSTNSILSNFQVYDFCFQDENIGWLAGTIDSDSVFAVILSTTDSGENWTIAWSNADVWGIKSIYFTDGNHGWAVGKGIILKYNDTLEWQALNPITDLPLNKVYFVNENYGWISAGYYNPNEHHLKLYKTTDGGENWDVLPNFDYEIRDFLFADTIKGWVVGNDTSGHGIILKTMDGGDTWTIQAEHVNVPLNAIYFKDGCGWVVGGDSEPLIGNYPRGIILKTTDGSTWIDEKNNKVYPSKFELSQNYPNPFNPKTAISYQLPAFSEVDLSIYNILGQKVATLVSEKQPAGRYKVEWDATKFASGVYIYKLSTDQGYTKAKKLILLK